MATKTFKIGEYAKGGIIKVSTTKDKIIISVIDMFGDEGEIAKQTSIYNEHDVSIHCYTLERRVSDFLGEITTCYYREKVMKWIKEKTGVKFFWC